jgi:hypothetical protein
MNKIGEFHIDKEEWETEKQFRENREETIGKGIRNFDETYMYTGELTLEMLEELIEDLKMNWERIAFPMNKPAYDALDAAMKVEFEKLAPTPWPTALETEIRLSPQDRNFIITTEEWTKERAKNWMKDTSK